MHHCTLCFYLHKKSRPSNNLHYSYTPTLRLSLSLSLSLTTQMDAKFLLHTSSPFSSFAHRRYTCKPPVCSPPILAVLTTPAETITQEATKTTSVIYNDNWFDQLAINHLSRSVQAASGLCIYIYDQFCVIETYRPVLHYGRTGPRETNYESSSSHAGLRSSKSGYESLVEAARIAEI